MSSLKWFISETFRFPWDCFTQQKNMWAVSLLWQKGGQHTNGQDSSLLRLPWLLYEIDLHPCFHWKCSVPQIVESFYGDITTGSNIVKRALHILVYRRVLNVMCALVKHPSVGKQPPDTAFLPQWLTVWVSESERWIRRVTAFSQWFNSGLVRIHPWTPNAKNGIRMNPAQAALKNQFRWCP